jgi:predicted DNA-binding transcriptional regulator YafY
MYHPTTRALAVLTLLQRHGRMTGAELARRLEVNSRTVRSYITMLQDLGAPIFAERGRDGAYEIDPGFKLPPMMFTNDEAIALEIGLLAARQLGMTATVAAIESARQKLEQAMPDDLRQRARALTETITLDLDTPPVALSGAVMLALSGAAHTGRRTHIRYRAGNGELTERGFDPYGVAYHSGFWYAVGYCGMRHDLRSFRLDRIENITLTGEHFERPKHFDAMAYVIQSKATIPRKFTYRVLLKTDLVTAQEIIFNMMGILEPEADGVMLTGTTDDLDWLARQLASYSFDFVVREPDALRDSLRRRAEELVRLADAAG